tara:strand:+ start:2113 stop:2844 length:732 start_codon:yes stop_codon:yes gene_type:complete
LLRASTTFSELSDKLPLLLIALTKDLKTIVGEEIGDAYRHGFKSAAEEGKVNVTMKKGGVNSPENKESDKLVFKEARMRIDFDQADEDAIRVISSNEVQNKTYTELNSILSTKLNQIITQSITEGRSINATVGEMQKVVNTEVYKLRRIARTEIINAGNEGRLASYKKQEARRKKPFKYTLIVTNNSRTCQAHRELARRIPATGLLMDDLIQLQQSVGSSYGLTLRGNSVLHPNQRTTLIRVI